MYRTIAAGLLALGLSLTGCETAQDRVTEDTCPAVVTVDRDEPVTCDADGSQRIDVTGYTVQECEDAGGRMNEGTCEDVDY